MNNILEMSAAKVAIALAISLVGLGAIAALTKRMRQSGEGYSSGLLIIVGIINVPLIALAVYGVIGLPILMSRVADIPQVVLFVIFFSVLGLAFFLWRRRRISKVTAVGICLVLIGFISQSDNFDRGYRRQVPDAMLKIDIPLTERTYLLCGIRKDILATSSLYGLHQLTVNIDELRAEAQLREVYKKTSPFWKYQHIVQLIEHLKTWEENGPLRTSFIILGDMQRSHISGISEENWLLARSIIEVHVASRQYHMLAVLLGEYVSQMREFHRTALRKNQVVAQFTSDIASIDEALANVDRESEKWSDILTFDRVLDAHSENPENATRMRDQEDSRMHPLIIYALAGMCFSAIPGSYHWWKIGLLSKRVAHIISIVGFLGGMALLRLVLT